MSDATAMADAAATARPRKASLLVLDKRTRQRNAAEARFRLMGQIAVTIGVLALVGLLTSILMNGLSSFRQTFISVDVYLDPAKLDKKGTRDIDEIAKVTTFGYAPLIMKALADKMQSEGKLKEIPFTERDKLSEAMAPAVQKFFADVGAEDLFKKIRSFD